ncbi:MAG: ShlB/FhaC/HecB family hemolysin secretion/activation protein [Gallionella sp.]|nr:ShlB/FhaC/HecB family hemolysin secretion/activation protein [Gallionella sp.]
MKVRYSGVLLALLAAGVLTQNPATAAEQKLQLAALPMETVQEQQQEEARATTFAINGYTFEGNQKLSADVLRSAVAPYVGSNKNEQDLLAAKSAILKAYSDAGYGLVAVGFPQEIGADGIVNLRIVEIKPGKIKVTGNSNYSEANIRAQLPALVDNEMPDQGALSRQMFLANDNPSRNIQMNFAPGNEPGVMDVELAVRELNPLRYGITLDTTGNQQSGYYRLGAIVHHSNLWDKSHIGALSFVTSPEKPDQVQQLGLHYQVPLAAWGDSVTFNASHSSVNNGLVANAFDISGQGQSIGAHYQRNLARDFYNKHVLDIGLDYRTYKNTINFFGFNLGVDVDERPLALAYQYSHNDAALEWGAGIGYVANISGGARNDNATYAASRVGASANWDAVRFNASAKYHTDSDWIVSAALDGQSSNKPLIAGEQYGIGGARSVRGYEEREVTGDSGERISLEVSTPRIADAHRFVAFIDNASMRRNNPQVGELPSKTLTGYGLGWRMGLQNGLNVNVDIAVAGNTGLTTQRNQTSTHLSAVWWF